MTLSLQEIAHILNVAAPPETEHISGWSIDTRTLAPRDLFFALEGPAHDGNAYVDTAFAKGAAAAVASKRTATEPGPILLVPDTLVAMQQVARAARSRWHGDMICVTGSAGKTTTKEVIAHFLSAEISTGKTVGNFNNHVGVPISILRMPDQCRAAVLELGMNHAGEIRDLAELARPKIGVVTNVGYAHMENFDSLDGVAAAKRELVEALPAEGLAVLNADDPRVARFVDSFSGRSVTFGIRESADVRAEEVEFLPQGIRFRVADVGQIESSMLGRTGVLNILAGLTVAREFGIAAGKLRDAAYSLPPGKMRGERLVHDGITIVNDCYNSNPDAAKAMLDVLHDTPAQRRFAILGEMLELGRWAEALHRDVGSHAAMLGIHVLVGIRGAARELVDSARQAGLAQNAAFFFDDPVEAGKHVKALARPGDAILFKGSRGTRVELALESFLQ